MIEHRAFLLQRVDGEVVCKREVVDRPIPPPLVVPGIGHDQFDVDSRIVEQPSETGLSEGITAKEGDRYHPECVFGKIAYRYWFPTLIETLYESLATSVDDD